MMDDLSNEVLGIKVPKFLSRKGMQAANFLASLHVPEQMAGNGGAAAGGVGVDRRQPRQATAVAAATAATKHAANQQRQPQHQQQKQPSQQNQQKQPQPPSQGKPPKPTTTTTSTSPTTATTPKRVNSASGSATIPPPTVSPVVDSMGKKDTAEKGLSIPSGSSSSSRPRSRANSYSTTGEESKLDITINNSSSLKECESSDRSLSVISPTPIIELPKDVVRIHHFRNKQLTEADWELLSDRASTSAGSGGVSFVVTRTSGGASVISFNSSTGGGTGNGDNSSHKSPFYLNTPNNSRPTLKRTASSSTIDSQDNALGPSGKGVLGVDYVEHVILPTDTLQGICIAYKVSSSNLRRANHFTGHSLQMAPQKLIIPISKQALRTGFLRNPTTDTKEYKLNCFLIQYPDISPTEAKAYLELADWDLDDALQSAKEDREWEQGDVVEEAEALKAGQISIQVENVVGANNTVRLKMKGTGHNPNKNSSSKSFDEGDAGKSGGETKEGDEEEYAATRTATLTAEAISQQEAAEAVGAESAAAVAASSSMFKMPSTAKPKVFVHAQLPAIATNSVLAQDVYNAALEDQSFGLELKPITKKPMDSTPLSPSSASTVPAGGGTCDEMTTSTSTITTMITNNLEENHPQSTTLPTL